MFNIRLILPGYQIGRQQHLGYDDCMQNELPVSEPLSNIDYAGFAAELDHLHQQLMADLGPADFQHLRKMERWGRLCSVLGYATAWLLFNPISALLISMGNVARWALMTHHVLHRGYDRVPGVPLRYTSKGFAKGWRRLLDWPDWLLPEAWSFEHNTLHHYHTGERLDPDLVEDRVHLMRRIPGPFWLKSLLALPFVLSWKLTYYAPNTLWMLQQRRSRPGKAELRARIAGQTPAIFHGAKLWWPFHKPGLEFWGRCLLPYVVFRFVLLPGLFLPLGTQAALNVLWTSLLAEIFTNIHTFLIIVPNHSGEDLYRFEGPVSDKAEFYVRQTVGSVNYTGGSNLSDFLQGWLNYQIEHHLWPDLPLLKYQQAQPQVEAICRKYGVPYVCEPLYKRVWKMWRLLTGQSRMRTLQTLKKEQRLPAMVLAVAAENPELVKN